jgi:hypothetical protein
VETGLVAVLPFSHTWWQMRRVARTDGGRLHHVADGKSLDCLVLGRASGAVRATDRVDVTTTLLVATTIAESSADTRESNWEHRWSTHLEARFLTILAVCEALDILIAVSKSVTEKG